MVSCLGAGQGQVKYAGMYKVIGEDHHEIVILNDKSFYLIHFLAVLAHEVTHHYLFRCNIHSPGVVDFEIMTDLAAIYLGFGPIILAGYQPSDAINCKLGYIDVSTITKAISYSYALRDWPYSEAINSFAWHDFYRYYFLAKFLFPKLI